jgi:hypothetical protein
MSFEESVKAEIAYRLVSEFVKERDRVAQGDRKNEIDYRLVYQFVNKGERLVQVEGELVVVEGEQLGLRESLIEALPPPKAQEVNANEYPPAKEEHWSIPVFHPWEFLIGTVEQPIGPIAPMVETVNLKRELWGRGDIYAWVWSGYHERTNTIFFAVLPARPQAAVSVKR